MIKISNGVFNFQFSNFNSYTYSCQLLIFNPSIPTAQNASMNAVARRALV